MYKHFTLTFKPIPCEPYWNITMVLITCGPSRVYFPRVRVRERKQGKSDTCEKNLSTKDGMEHTLHRSQRPQRLWLRRSIHLYEVECGDIPQPCDTRMYQQS